MVLEFTLLPNSGCWFQICLLEPNISCSQRNALTLTKSPFIIFDKSNIFFLAWYLTEPCVPCKHFDCLPLTATFLILSAENTPTGQRGRENGGWKREALRKDAQLVKELQCGPVLINHQESSLRGGLWEASNTGTDLQPGVPPLQ